MRTVCVFVIIHHTSANRFDVENHTERDYKQWARYGTTTTTTARLSRVLPEKLTGPQLVKKFLAFYVTRRFITAFTRACHLFLSLARLIQSMRPKINFNIILPSTPGSPKNNDNNFHALGHFIVFLAAKAKHFNTEFRLKALNACGDSEIWHSCDCEFMSVFRAPC
jgi:hypothetical protein